MEKQMGYMYVINVSVNRKNNHDLLKALKTKENYKRLLAFENLYALAGIHKITDGTLSSQYIDMNKNEDESAVTFSSVRAFIDDITPIIVDITFENAIDKIVEELEIIY